MGKKRKQRISSAAAEEHLTTSSNDVDQSEEIECSAKTSKKQKVVYNDEDNVPTDSSDRVSKRPSDDGSENSAEDPSIGQNDEKSSICQNESSIDQSNGKSSSSFFSQIAFQELPINDPLKKALDTMKMETLTEIQVRWTYYTSSLELSVRPNQSQYYLKVAMY